MGGSSFPSCCYRSMCPMFNGFNPYMMESEPYVAFNCGNNGWRGPQEAFPYMPYANVEVVNIEEIQD